MQAWTDINNVELYLYDDSYTLSTYYVYNGSLIHTISTDLVQGNANSIAIGPAPKFLKKILPIIHMMVTIFIQAIKT